MPYDECHPPSLTSTLKHAHWYSQADEVQIEEDILVEDDEEQGHVLQTRPARQGLLKRSFQPGSASMARQLRGEKVDKENMQRVENMQMMMQENRSRDARAADLMAVEGAKDRLTAQANADTFSEGLNSLALALAPDAGAYMEHWDDMIDRHEARALKKRNNNK